MNNNEIYQNWDLIKVQLKQRFDTLTGSDIILVNGHQDDLMGRLEMKLSKTKTEIEALIAEIREQNDSNTKH
ncbi:MAG: general stress protein CsbD [Flavobacteriaceae bacterium]|nr:general stress protein CsbD [Flavobacteriaceae bacterium]